MTLHSFTRIFFLTIFSFLSLVAFTQPVISISLNTPANAGILSEGCDGPYELVIERLEGNTDTIIITFEDLGQALNGDDYIFPVGTVFPIQMLPGTDVLIFPLTIFQDGPEGLETLIWEFLFQTSSTIDDITITSGIVDEYDVEITSASDTIQWCRFEPLALHAVSDGLVNWSPSPAFTPSTGNDVVVAPFASGWYYASVGTDTCGDIDSVYIDLAIANINSNDTVFICKGEPGIQLNGQILGLATGFNWVPTDSLSDPNSLTPTATPEVTTMYILESDFGVCVARDTVVVRVDSLPEDLHIEIAPTKPYYCQGEIVALFSPLYDTIKYPDITFKWGPDNGTFQSELDILNASLQLLDTTLYIRQNQQNACVSSDSILINVVSASVPLSLTDTVLCPGESFEVEVLADVSEPEWMPEEGLSCVMCLSPTVTVNGTPGSSLQYQFSGMILECPVGANLFIQIPPSFDIAIDGDNVVCEGDVRTYTIQNGDNLIDIDWEVLAGSASLSCDDCLAPTVTINSSGQVILGVTANYNGEGFCGAIGTIVLNPGGAETIQIGGENVVCEGDVTTLTAINAGSFTNLEWHVSGNATLSCTQCNSTNVTITGIEDVTVSITGESSNPDFCSAYGEHILSHGQDVQYPGFNLYACEGGTVVGTTGDPTLTNLHWEIISMGNNLSLSCNDCPNPVITVNGPGKIRVSADSPNPDTCNVTIPIDVLIAGGDTTFFNVAPDTIHQGSEAIVMLLTNQQLGTNFTWTVNGQPVPGNTNILTFNANAPVNIVEVTYTNSKGCEQTDTVHVNTIPAYYDIPNAFTPNNDMINDVFVPILHGNIEIIRFQIFNRWGQMVYRATGDALDGWDGTFKGEPAASDTYVYTLELRFPDGERETAQGDVILLK